MIWSSMERQEALACFSDRLSKLSLKLATRQLKDNINLHSLQKIAEDSRRLQKIAEDCGRFSSPSFASIW